jgi:tetratricopeptide (TPR) repeat protein
VLRGRLAVERERLLARPLLEELRAGGRKWSELKPSEKRLLEGFPLVDHLLERSLEMRYSDPAGMVQLAQAACLVAKRVSPRRYGRRVLADLQARAWAELGNAYRVTDNLPAAEAAFGQAVRFSRRGTGSVQVIIHIEERVARLFSDLGLFPEAAAMLDRVCSYYVAQGDATRAGQTLISRGLVAGYDNDPELASVYLARGLRVIGPHGDSDLRLAAVHALAMNLVDAGRSEAARALLASHERLYRRGGSLNKLRLHWLKGKIAYGLGELGRAEADFHVARLGFRRAGKNYDAALVSLDLALLLAAQGKRLATLRLVDEMIGTFRTLRIAREAIASLTLLRRSCEKSGIAPDTLCAQIRTIACLVQELQRPRISERKDAS